uniref:Nucleoporin NUP42 n=1 Tax=Nothobranchius kuhntae TaxID=321403 RepID=A0A1A8ITG5_NOTKU
MENDGKESAEEAKQSFPRTQQLCRFFSQGRRCNFGNKCKFLHVRELKADKTLNQSDATISDSQGQHEEHKLPVSHNPRIAQAAARRPCRYFLSGYCSMEDRCRFWHPQEILDNVPVAGNHNKAAQSFPPVSRPSGPQEVKLCNVTEDVAKQLRETEIRQLKKRFPKDQLIIQERSDGKVTYYRVTVEATDPDWVDYLRFILTNVVIFV